VEGTGKKYGEKGERESKRRKRVMDYDKKVIIPRFI
jgi:hypothetical protein